MNERKSKEKHARDNEKIIVHERKTKQKNQRKNEGMIVDEEKKKCNILNEIERETCFLRWDNRNINPTFGNLSLMYDGILYLLKNNIYFSTSNAEFNNAIDSTMNIICSNSQAKKRSINNWFTLYDEMKILLMMYTLKYFKSINDNVNPSCLKILQEKHPLNNNFLIENITKERIY